MKKKLLIISTVLVVTCTAIGILGFLQYQKYEKAETLYLSGDYESALTLLSEVLWFNKQDMIDECEYGIGIEKADFLFANKDYESAKQVYTDLGTYKDTSQFVKTCDEKLSIQKAEDLIASGDYSSAQKIYEDLSMDNMVNECIYLQGMDFYHKKEYKSAQNTFSLILDYKDSLDQYKDTVYCLACIDYENKSYDTAEKYFNEISEYKKANEYIEKCKLGKKYESYNTSSGSNTQSGSVDYIELLLENCNLIDSKWYNLSSDEVIQTERFYINSKEFSITDCCETPDGVAMDFYYREDNSKTSHHLELATVYDYVDVTPDYICCMSLDNEAYYNIPNGTRQKYDQFIQEHQSIHSISEVYNVAKEDVKTHIYNSVGIIDAMTFAVGVQWSYSSENQLQYSYNLSNKIHYLQFTVKMTDYFGLGDRIAFTAYVQYSEDAEGNLHNTDIQLYK